MLYNVDLTQWFKKNRFLLKLIDRAVRRSISRNARILNFDGSFEVLCGLNNLGSDWIRVLLICIESFLLVPKLLIFDKFCPHVENSGISDSTTYLASLATPFNSLRSSHDSICAARDIDTRVYVW